MVECLLDQFSEPCSRFFFFHVDLGWHSLIAKQPSFFFIERRYDLLRLCRHQGTHVCRRVIATGERAIAKPTHRPQLTQSKNLYHIPANGKNQGLPLYNPSGAPRNGMPTKGFSGLSPAINSAIFCP